MITIREERSSDLKTINEINDLAFGQPQEALVINKIRASGAEILSLVAEIDDRVVGHIFFSPAEIEYNDEKIVGMGLAPMAVLPEFQKKGIGKALINESLNILNKKQTAFIIVLGHPAYYPKFGFERASKYGIKCQWQDVPDEAFMIMILNHDKMANVTGTAKYREEWNEAM